MKINDLTKEFGESIDNKTVIAYLNSKGFDVKSHMQTATDDMIKNAREHFATTTVKQESEDVQVTTAKEEKEEINLTVKTFKPDDIIPCRSVIPYKLIATGVDKNVIYHWNWYGDVDYLTYRDLQALRRTEYITKPLIIIEDANLCYQWRNELGDTYKYFLGVEYPEEFFEKNDVEFTKLLTEAPDVLKEVIKITAMSMIKNKNYPAVQKVHIIDDTLGTCIKEFL